VVKQLFPLPPQATRLYNKPVSQLLAQTTPTNCDDPGAGGVNLSDCLQLGTGKTVKEVYDKPAVLVNTIVKNVFVVAGIIIFITFLYAGFKLISDTTKGKDEAKSILTTAIKGLIIMFAAYWVVKILAVVTGAPISI